MTIAANTGQRHPSFNHIHLGRTFIHGVHPTVQPASRAHVLPAILVGVAEDMWREIPVEARI